MARMTGKLLSLDDIPVFAEVRKVKLADIREPLRVAVKKLHEAHDIEQYIRSILSDRAATPHGPAEIADILTHRVVLNGSNGLAAFVLKGRSFATVRPKDVSHQIYRLEKIDGLHFAAFGATGVVLDSVKEQFASTCVRLNIAYAFLDADDFARLFFAYGFLCPNDGSRIVGGRCHCGYAPGHSVLNILQTDALAELNRAHQLKQSKALVVLPPGSGKTRIAARDAHSSGARSILYIAHTHEILDVAASEFSACFGSQSVGRLEDLQLAPLNKKPVTLGTIQYLREHFERFAQFRFDYFVIDEFHHAAAATYRRAVKSISYDFLLGLTATPFRADRQDIAALCDGNIVAQYELRAAIDMGILTPYHYFGCFDDVNYGDLPLGSYSVRDLERKLIIKERHHAIVQKWQEKAEGRPTLAFCCTHRHAETIATAFSELGIPAATYLSSTTMDKRREMVEELRGGRLKVLCVVDVLNEGADLPFVECLLFVRPTDSKRIFLQQLGRGLRKHVGKTHCVIIDFIGNFMNAYRVVEYQGLRPEEGSGGGSDPFGLKNVREILDIPLGCKVNFEDRVLDIFQQQALDPRHATRDNIGRILIHQYHKLSGSLGRSATAKDVDRYALLNSTFYKTIFGSWDKFQRLVTSNP